MNIFNFSESSLAKKTNNANNATHYVKLGKKRRESSKRNYYTISPRVIIKAIIIKHSLANHHLQQHKPCGALRDGALPISSFGATYSLVKLAVYF